MFAIHRYHLFHEKKFKYFSIWRLNLKSFKIFNIYICVLCILTDVSNQVRKRHRWELNIKFARKAVGMWYEDIAFCDIAFVLLHGLEYLSNINRNVWNAATNIIESNMKNKEFCICIFIFRSRILNLSRIHAKKLYYCS